MKTGSESTIVTAYQFMEHYYYSLGQIALTTLPNSTQKSLNTIKNLQFLFDNWDNMKFINHEAIYLYLDAGEK